MTLLLPRAVIMMSALLAHQVAAFGSRVADGVASLHGLSSAVCTRQPPSASTMARFRRPSRSPVHVRLRLLCLRSDFVFAMEKLPAPAPPLNMSAAVRMGAVVDARLGLV